MHAATARLQAAARSIAHASMTGAEPGTQTGAASSIDLGQEIVQLMAARNDFAANAHVAETAARMLNRLIDIRI